MIVSEFINDVWVAYKGKSSRKPSAGQAKWNDAVTIANRKIRIYARNKKVSRDALYDERDLSTVITVNTQGYELDDEFVDPASKKVLIIDTNDDEHEFKLIAPSQKYRFTKAAFISGANPKILTFTDDFLTGNRLLGGTIRVPGLWMPDALESEDDEIPVDNPDWLVYEVAAELARNDPAKQDQFPNLQGLANNEWAEMMPEDPSEAEVEVDAIGDV